MEFHEIAYEFLKSAKVSVSRDYLRERLESHPYYPSLNALTDILDELQIESSALQIEEKQRWRELPFPILAHVVSENGQLDFEVIKNQQHIKTEGGFLQKWTGITLLIGKQRKITHEEHQKQFIKEKFEGGVLWSWVTFLLLLATMPQLISFKLGFFIHYVLSLTGCLVSCNIVAYSLGVKTDMSDLFCKVETSGCNAVLTSKLGRLTGDIGLADIATVFYGGMVIYMSFSTGFEPDSNLLFLNLVQALPFFFTFLSVAYQAHMKSWCKLCLLLTLIIWLQSINLVFGLMQLPFDNFGLIAPPFMYYLTLVLSMALAGSWFIVKPLLLTKRSSMFQKIRIRKWRQNPHWFNALLPLHKQIDSAVWNKEIFYGNPNGVLQILITSKPLCEYCAKAHFELEQILKKHPDDIGVRVRFTLPSLNTETEDYKAVFHILNMYEELVWKKGQNHTSPLMKEIISDWYETQNLSDWVDRYPVHAKSEEEVHALIGQSVQWANAMGITQTPAFFINGFEMPNPHTFKDLFLFISEYIEILKGQRSPVSSQ
ncbi:thioredoxin domain-containing protein [Flagellimonas allohymeniacidonis]|uniref:Thioredoxin-like fold domain-containing protein n=1 Tax=Flagellimonas allohymeniacidonis TaxID=2517819 RepID=A0A4Q8QHH8_9FLAO|nr:thioredoxin domain-containing protein [Allomuricauda hymeniacidonis]TAI48093.1 hypothetical protein EW142_15715 [Allomuricauda hymeniacidonis]